MPRSKPVHTLEFGVRPSCSGPGEGFDHDTMVWGVRADGSSNKAKMRTNREMRFVACPVQRSEAHNIALCTESGLVPLNPVPVAQNVLPDLVAPPLARTAEEHEVRIGGRRTQSLDQCGSVVQPDIADTEQRIAQFNRATEADRLDGGPPQGCDQVCCAEFGVNHDICSS